MYLWTRKNRLNSGYYPSSRSGCRNLLKDSCEMWQFSTIWLIFLEKLIRSLWKFHDRCIFGQEIPVKVCKSLLLILRPHDVCGQDLFCLCRFISLLTPRLSHKHHRFDGWFNSIRPKIHSYISPTLVNFRGIQKVRNQKVQNSVSILNTQSPLTHFGFQTEQNVLSVKIPPWAPMIDLRCNSGASLALPYFYGGF